MAKLKLSRHTEKKQRSRAKQNANLIPFTKGDPRINRRGRPRNFDELRALVREIGAQKLKGSDLTRVEAMIMAMASSRNPRDRELFLQYGFGKVKDEVEVRGDEKVNVILEWRTLERNGE